MRNGLVTYSTAHSRVAATAESIVPYCVSTITGSVGLVSWTRLSRSSPLVCCSIKSVNEISTAEYSSTSKASAARATAMAFMPACRATSAQVSRMEGSSSTMRMFIETVPRRTAPSSLMREPTDSIIAFQAFLFPFQEIAISQVQCSIYLNWTIMLKDHFGKFARQRYRIARVSVCVINCVPKWNGHFRLWYTPALFSNDESLLLVRPQYPHRL